MTFVVVFEPDLVTMPGDDESVGDIELVVVTGWRNKPGNMW